MANIGGRDRRQRRLRWSASLAFAVGVNLVVIILLGIGGRRPVRFFSTPVVELQLPRPGPQARSESQMPQAASRQARPSSTTTATDPALRQPTLAPVSPQAAATPAGQGAESGGGGGGGGSADLGQVFRAGLGCGDRDGLRLTPEERARCDTRLGQGARQAAAMPAPIDPGKRAWFDATYAAYHPKGAMDGALPVPIGCKVKFGGPHKKFKPPNSLKIPGLPCYVIPPRGVLTEESGVVRPEHVEAR